MNVITTKEILQEQAEIPKTIDEDRKNDDNPVWEELSPIVWRNAIYSDEAIDNCMGQLFIQEVNLFEELIRKIKQENKKCALIEVGMGTAELFAKLYDEIDMIIGVELSQQMIDCAFQLHETLRELNNKKVFLLQGNATELNKVIRDNSHPEDHEFWRQSTTRLSCMCMNTFGILPDHIRDLCIKEMFMCSGPGGKLVIGCWHRESLRTGYQQFYSKLPQLCGECKEEDFDFEKGNFKCSSSDYTSHWFTKEELSSTLVKCFPGDADKDLKIEF